MRDRVKARLTYANVVASVAVFIALGGGAYAATGTSLESSNGAINGCVPKRGGTLLVLRAGKRCPRGDTSLAFNARGRVGPAGAPGKNGLNGASGSNGTNGVDGGPGPTASAYSTLTTPSSFTSINNDVPVGQATITTTFTGRIVVNASLDVERTSGNGDVTCQLWIGPPGTFSQLTSSRIGNPEGAAFASASINGTLYEVSIPLTAAAVKPAGSYAIEATCQTGSAASFIAGDIAAVAAAQ
jgi:hypothetical protein